MKWTRRILWVVGLIVALFFLWPLALDRTPVGAMLTYLPVGWWLFLERNIPQISFNRGLVTTCVVLSALVLGLGNWFLSVLCQQAQIRSQPGKVPRKWRWRWTAGLYASVWLLFLTAFGAAGVLRHTAWLLDYNQPWYEKRGYSYRLLSDADSAVFQILIDDDQDLESTRKALPAAKYWSETNPLCEDFNVILYGDSSNKVAGCLIIPRDTKLLDKGGFAFLDPQGGRLVKPLSELPQLVLEMDAKYPSKVSR